MAVRLPSAFGALMLGASCLLFTGCASVRPANDLFAATQDTDATVTRYQGRFSARYTQGNAEQSAVGSFLWRERGPDVQLELMSPLGQTLAIVSQNNQGATLELPNQPARRAPEVDTLMQDALGFSLPVSGLRDWLRARPAPGTPARVARDAQSRPETIEQNGWTVRYVAWTDDAPGDARIRRLDLERPQGANGPLTVRLVLDQ
ncbi:lipoprotein insertase outer membrane protein LolB [Ralstonia mannitolilytica]|uniref:Outer-membrane lipoprotein LolB n=1 Tax=Ralstonia mannitolilytica TaxID=105219 RepID=A0AAD2EML0_9RALS|nr:lipoprotein insertase outer membrane protein LolB [Ralstonia mannitolilytica]MBY4720216.1 lipoprotein insertase outer membrane protein LolB [Ralstonia mannitolilytica]CAJ0693891.1 Outer-membrane lipoprotein LolB [Ralstonia mannitolilytica]CAJ0714573.1 Outer-membrane lipoprotein LolB [Ralstonia mannitolilytica]CAJ0785798.1 Outer-membrane lipoprotein LolB [Ralstonia mannitolilytica]CAJ0870151.1 Outer-membrane lipoprotein LolB [Ralstonia mannitolilytica]